MNCQDIAAILDDGDSRGLSAAERRDVESHLTGCTECRMALAAHEAMGAMAMPPMSPELAERSRRLVVAQVSGQARRAGGRPFIVVGLLLAGAAAALVGLGIVDERDDDPGIAAQVTSESESVAVAPEALAEPSFEANTGTAPVDIAVDPVATNGAFTVAVTPINIDSVPAAGAVYRQFLEELGEIPNLELVELEAVERASVDFATLAGTSLTVNSTQSVTSPPGGAVANFQSLEGGARTLVLVDSSRFVTNSNGTVDMSTIPTALVGRIEQVTREREAASAGDPAATEAMRGVVNVILDNNIEGVRVDHLSYAGAATAPFETMTYDYTLQVSAESTASAEDATSADDWRFSVRARSRSGLSFGSSFDLQTPDPAAAADMIEQAIAHLKDHVFPVDATTLGAIERRVVDTSLPLDERLRELNRLREMNERSGVSQLADDVALAAVDIATRANDVQRLVLLRALRGVDNPVLIPPLSNILRNDLDPALRLEAVFVLANLQQDALARAALEAAANSDAVLEIRNNARWAALDAAGRRNHVVASLLDTRLSDAERIEPMFFELPWANSRFTRSIELGSALDATVANELAGLLRREEQEGTRARVVMRLRSEISPALTPLFVERLNEDPAEVVRMSAMRALESRLNEPGVRNALERAAAADTSMGVRETATRILATGN